MRVNLVSAAVFWILGLCLPAYGQLTWQSASNLWNNFNNAFYVSAGSGAYYKWQQGGSFQSNDRWENAEMIEMATDRYIAEPNSQDNAILTALLNEFDSIYGKDWTSDQYNDDIMWCVLAHARAYMAIYTATKTVSSSMKNWAVNASNNFCWVYHGNHSPNRVNPQYDNTFGGGMWWTNNSNPATAVKNSCVNGPAALAAFYLNVIYPNAGFWAMATNMINWETTYLVISRGYLYDHYAASGPVSGDYSYNVGTYVGAAGLLGVGIPETVAEYYTNNSCPNDILRSYHQSPGGQNNDGFNGIFLRWVGTYEYLTGNTNWDGFFNNQAAAAWAITNSYGLSWDDWQAATPQTNNLFSWDCSPAVVALQWVQISQNASAPVAPLDPLTATLTNGELQLTWPYGTLQAATSVSGPFSDLSGVSSPYLQTTAPPRKQRYFRVREF
jgi:predicted alpha-1,6-mannanase (GH76 family)